MLLSTPLFQSYNRSHTYVTFASHIAECLFEKPGVNKLLEGKQWKSTDKILFALYPFAYTYRFGLVLYEMWKDY